MVVGNFGNAFVVINNQVTVSVIFKVVVGAFGFLSTSLTHKAVANVLFSTADEKSFTS
jgi:hypothetical protein